MPNVTPGLESLGIWQSKFSYQNKLGFQHERLEYILKANYHIVNLVHSYGYVGSANVSQKSLS